MLIGVMALSRTETNHSLFRVSDIVRGSPLVPRTSLYIGYGLCQSKALIIHRSGISRDIMRAA